MKDEIAINIQAFSSSKSPFHDDIPASFVKHINTRYMNGMTTKNLLISESVQTETIQRNQLKSMSRKLINLAILACTCNIKFTFSTNLSCVTIS